MIYEVEEIKITAEECEDTLFYICAMPKDGRDRVPIIYK